MTLPNEDTGPVDGMPLVLYRLNELREGQRAMNDKIDALPERYVTRREWEARNRVVDDRFDDKGREIGDNRAAINRIGSNTRANLAMIFAGVASIVGVIGLVIK